MSPQAYARTAGVLYLIVIAGGLFAEVFVRQRMVVANDAAATANNILAHEQLFRLGFAAGLIPLFCLLPMALIFYELLKIVNSRVALLVVFFSLVGGAIEGAALVGHFAPLVLLKRGQELGVDVDLLQAQSYMAINLQAIGFAVALTFFGGTLVARGYLVFKSAFLPRTFGVLLALGGAAYVTNSFVVFLAPGLAGYAVAVLILPAIAELSLSLWLLVKGVDVQTWHSVRAASIASRG